MLPHIIVIVCVAVVGWTATKDVKSQPQPKRFPRVERKHLHQHKNVVSYEKFRAKRLLNEARRFKQSAPIV